MACPQQEPPPLNTVKVQTNNTGDTIQRRQLSRWTSLVVAGNKLWVRGLESTAPLHDLVLDVWHHLCLSSRTRVGETGSQGYRAWFPARKSHLPTHLRQSQNQPEFDTAPALRLLQPIWR